MELTWIDDFIALDETQNFTKASQQRYTTQPAFSRRIKTMEEWMGAPLFNRDTRPVTLSDSGKSCKKRIYRLREDIVDLKRITNLAVSNLPATATVIYTTNTIAIGILPKWVEASSLQNYRLVISSVSHALETIKKHECDYAILPRFDFFKDDAYKHADIIHQDRLVFISPKNQKQVMTKDSLDGNVVMYSPKTAFGQAIEVEMQKRGMTLSHSPICESASAEAILAQIKNGLGCGWVVASLLNDEDKQMIDHTIFSIPFDLCLIKNT